jgi:hypothetical protein
LGLWNIGLLHRFRIDLFRFLTGLIVERIE